MHWSRVFADDEAGESPTHLMDEISPPLRRQGTSGLRDDEHALGFDRIVRMHATSSPPESSMHVHSIESLRSLVHFHRWLPFTTVPILPGALEPDSLDPWIVVLHYSGLIAQSFLLHASEIVPPTILRHLSAISSSIRLVVGRLDRDVRGVEGISLRDKHALCERRTTSLQRILFVLSEERSETSRLPRWSIVWLHDNVFGVQSMDGASQHMIDSIYVQRMGEHHQPLLCASCLECAFAR